MPDLLAPGSVETMLLLSLRIGALMLIAPVFAAQTIPPMIKAGLIVMFGLLLHGVATANTAGTPSITPASILSETVIGLALGLGAALIVGAASLAGDLMGIQIGLSGAAVLDPLNSAENALGQFAGWFAITLLLSVDGHLVMLDAVAKSLQALPVGGPIRPEGVLPLVKQASTVFALGIQFAAPVVATILIVNTALAIFGRAAPQLNLLSVAFPIQIGVGLFALAAAIPFIGAFYAGWSTMYVSHAARAVRALSGGMP
jgi:flagellar biosynthetic protein FliR